MAEKLFLPSELQMTNFLREGERFVTRRELYTRASELGAVTGAEQFQFLWDHRKEFPRDWERRAAGLLVPDEGADRMRVFKYYRPTWSWDRYEDTRSEKFFVNYCVLVPRVVGA